MSAKAPETATVLTSQQEPVIIIGFTRPQGPVVIIIKTDITAGHIVTKTINRTASAFKYSKINMYANDCDHSAFKYSKINIYANACDHNTFKYSMINMYANACDHNTINDYMVAASLQY